jgi:hypothetical protein
VRAQRAIWLALLVLSCSKKNELPQHTAIEDRRPAPELAVATTAGSVRSFFHPHGSGCLDSHVDAKARKLSTTTRTALDICTWPAWTNRQQNGPEDTPRAVVVSPNGQHAAVASKGTVFLFEPAGACLALPRIDHWPCRDVTCHDGELTIDVVANDDEVFVDGEPWGWDSVLHKDQLVAHGPALAREVLKYDYVAVQNLRGISLPHQGSAPDSVLFESSQRWATGKKHWSGRIWGHTGLGAVAADWSVVLVRDDGKVMVFAPKAADWEGQATLVATGQVPRLPQWLSLVGPLIVLLTPDETGTRVTALSSAAKPRFQLYVPFPASQPAIRGAGARLYVIGKGLSAFDEGKHSWSRSYDEMAYASSFEDGSLAVASGTRLELLDSHGEQLQAFDTAEPLVTPPAIASDGSVWVASNTALYVMR